MSNKPISRDAAALLLLRSIESLPRKQQAMQYLNLMRASGTYELPPPHVIEKIEREYKESLEETAKRGVKQ